MQHDACEAAQNGSARERRHLPGGAGELPVKEESIKEEDVKDEDVKDEDVKDERVKAEGVDMAKTKMEVTDLNGGADQQALVCGSGDLMMEVWQGNLDHVQALLAGRADPHITHPTLGQNLVFFAASQPRAEAAVDGGGAPAAAAADVQSRHPLLELLIGSYGVDAVTVDRRNRQTPLFFSARDGDTASCAYLIGSRCSPDHRDAFEQSPIFYAARGGHLECTELLLQRRGIADCIDKKGQSPVFYAAKRGHLEVLTSLLRHAADVTRTDSVGQTCLHQASVQCTAALLEAMCGVNTRDSGGTTALFSAAESGSLERVRLLVDNGAEVSVADKTGWTCLFWAAREGRTEVCALLVEGFGADPSHKDLAGRTARTAAAVYGKGPTAALLEGIERRRANRGLQFKSASAAGGSVPSEVVPVTKVVPRLIDRLYHAVHTETLSQVQACIDAGADPSDVMIPRGQTLVFVAAARPKGACEVCSLLVRQRMDPTVVDTQFRQTALFFAVRNSERSGGLECTRFLLRARCDPDHVDMHGQTPLFYAVQRGDPSCARALLECSVDFERRDVRSQTAAFFAAKEGAEDSLRCLLAARACTNTCDSVGQSALFYAKKAAVVETLLTHRCDAHRHDNSGMTALMVLAGHGFDGSVRHLAAREGDVRAEDSSGQTCLFYAAKGGSVKTIRVLVEECGADLLHTSHKKATAADVAALNGKQAAVAALSELTTEALKTTRAAAPPKSSSGGSRKRALSELPGGPSASATSSATSAVAPGSLPGKATRREYVFVFDDPKTPGRTIPFGTPEYAIALQRLTNKCPWLDQWDKLAPMYSPTAKPGGMASD